MPSCVGCTATKRRLNKSGIAYAEKDAHHLPGDVSALGYTQAPVVVVRDNAGDIHDSFSGYRPDRLRQLVTRGTSRADSAT